MSELDVLVSKCYLYRGPNLSFTTYNGTKYLQLVGCVLSDLAIQRIGFGLRMRRSMFCGLCFFRAPYGVLPIYVYTPGIRGGMF